MNKLSFEYTSLFVEEPGNSYERYTIFFYIDGKKLDFDTFSPPYTSDILEVETDWDFPQYKMQILNHCSCGSWGCDSIVATIIEKKESVVWRIHNLRSTDIIAEYEFDITEYKQTIEAVRNAAKTDCLEDYLFYYANGEIKVNYCPSETILFQRWKNEQKENVIYFEEIKSGNLFCFKNNKKVPYTK